MDLPWLLRHASWWNAALSPSYYQCDLVSVLDNLFWATSLCLLIVPLTASHPDWMLPGYPGVGQSYVGLGRCVQTHCFCYLWQCVLFDGVLRFNFHMKKYHGITLLCKSPYLLYFFEYCVTIWQTSWLQSFFYWFVRGGARNPHGEMSLENPLLTIIIFAFLREEYLLLSFFKFNFINQFNKQLFF